MLGSDRPSPGWPARPGTGAVYVMTDEPDALFQRAVAAGAEVLREPGDTDYGSREFAVTDPEGNLWSFGTRRLTGSRRTDPTPHPPRRGPAPGGRPRRFVPIREAAGPVQFSPGPPEGEDDVP